MAVVDLRLARRAAWLFTGVLALVLAHPAQSVAQPRFEAALARTANLGPLPRLADALARHAATQKLPSDCKRSLFRRCPLADWRHELDRLADRGRLAQIEAVNFYLNRVDYVEDARNYGTEDYWATPAEFLARGGDCEDYAIAKYVSLRALGLADADMQIVALWDERRRIHHAVLLVRLGGRALVLDNQTPRILAAGEIRGYRPLYSANQSGWWLHRS